MPEELLIDLDEGKGFDATLGGLEGLRRLFVEQARSVLDLVIPFPSQVRQRWGQLCRAVAAGHLEQVHRLRPEFSAWVETRLSHLKDAQRLASKAAVLEDAELPGSAELPRLIRELERFRDRVFSAWKTPEDLEDLAAADYPLPASRLEALCRHYPPPPDWCQQEDKPF